MAEATKKATTQDVVDAIKGQTEALIELVKVLTPKARVLEAPVPVETKPQPEQPTRTIPVPVDWRAVTDEVLNQKFGLEVEPHTGDANITLHFIVPLEYSNAPKSYIETYKEDRRPIVLSPVAGAPEVRAYAEKVFKNFDLTTQSRIIADRINA